MTHAANVAAANRAKAICRANRLEHYRASDRERKRRQRLDSPGKINAIGRAADQRRREKLANFLRSSTRDRTGELETFARAGVSIINERQLAAPMFIFELRGVRRFERWYAPVLADALEEEVPQCHNNLRKQKSCKRGEPSSNAKPQRSNCASNASREKCAARNTF